MPREEKRYNGQTKRSQYRIRAWQHMLNNGLSIARMAVISAKNCVDRRGGLYKHRERIAHLIETGVLKDRLGAYEAYQLNRGLRFHP